ncbi:MAG: capsular biosynthesis protein [Gammaproteobacteria bacterium]|nr:MAG: capsular biosynthesis protein [Gammaproteobacteria bacterium]
MFDLHCHFLPGIDDGAKDISESLDLACYAVKSGITHAILTPHIHQGRFHNDRLSIYESFKVFQQALLDNQIPLKVGFAAEVRIDHEIIDWVEQGIIPFLGRKQEQDVMLLELPHSHIPAGTENMVKWLLSKNIVPIIAHPERNKEIMKEPRKILPLYNLGCLFQLTAGAVAGNFGDVSRSTAEDLLKNGLVHILASDAHNLKHRPPELEPGRIAAEKIIGESASWDLVISNPRTIAEQHFNDRL